MTKRQNLVLRKIEEEARAYETNHGYDLDNNALLELAREAQYQLKTGGTLDDAFDSCLNSYRDALDEARADITERINL